MLGLPEPLQDLIVQYADLMALAYGGFGEGRGYAVIPPKGSSTGGGVKVRNQQAHRMLRDLEYQVRLIVREMDRQLGKLE